MAGNAQKTPILFALPTAARAQADRALALTGKALPASVVSVMGSIVTIKFELTNIPFTLQNMTVPLFGLEWIRYPIKAGTKGVVFPCDTSIGAMSGLGTGIADLSNPGNLAALVFFPIGNKNWADPESANALELYGDTAGVWIKNKQAKDWYIRLTSDGITLSNAASTVAIILTSTGIEFKGLLSTFDNNVSILGGLQIAGAIQAIGGGTYSQNIHTSGTVTGDAGVSSGGIGLTTHKHTGVTTGGGTTGGPTP